MINSKITGLKESTEQNIQKSNKGISTQRFFRCKTNPPQILFRFLSGVCLDADGSQRKSETLRMRSRHGCCSSFHELRHNLEEAVKLIKVSDLHIKLTRAEVVCWRLNCCWMCDWRIWRDILCSVSPAWCPPVLCCELVVCCCSLSVEETLQRSLNPQTITAALSESIWWLSL